MAEQDRETVIALDRKRRKLREELSGDAAQAKHDLHPSTVFNRWKADKKAQLANLAESGAQVAKKNAPFIGLAGAATLLFALRKPISKAFDKLRDKARDIKDPNP